MPLEPSTASHFRSEPSPLPLENVLIFALLGLDIIVRRSRTSRTSRTPSHPKLACQVILFILDHGHERTRSSARSMLRNPNHKRCGKGACHHKSETSRLMGLCVLSRFPSSTAGPPTCPTCHFLSGPWSGNPIAFVADFTFYSTKRGLGAHRRNIGGSSLAGSLRRRSLPLSLYPSSHLLMNPPSHLLPSLFPPAGVRGRITRYVTTIKSPSTTYHFYELEVSSLDKDWLESKERRREWVDYAEASRRVAWKSELAQGLSLSSLAPQR